MSETSQTPTGELADLQLPALAHNLQRLESTIDRPATNLADLGQLFSDDPGLSVALFRELARTPRATQLSIADPGRVIGLLGMEAVRNLARRTPTLETRYRGPALEGLRRCYGRALHAARFARRLATLRGRSDAEPEVLAALLQGLGEMALWARRPGTMAGLEGRFLQPEDLELTAYRKLGLDLGALGGELARAWGLPLQVQRVQSFTGSHDTNLQLPLLAAAIARCGSADWRSAQTREMLELAADLTHLDADMVCGQIHKETAETARLLHAMGLPHSADQLLLPPGGAPAGPAPTPPVKAVPKRPPPTASATASPKRPPVAAATERAAEPARPAAVAPPAPQKPKAKPNLLDHLSRIMREMRDDLGMHRIMFAMPTPDRKLIRARYVLEAEPSQLNRFSVSTGRRNLFSLLLEKPHALWVNSGNQSKYLPHIPEQVASLVNTHGFYLVSIVVKNRPVALFYADAGSNLTVMDNDHFQLFRKLCQRAGHLLGSG